MDETERERKLKAGKKKLAAYLKKKSPNSASPFDENSKKITKGITCATNVDVDDCIDVMDSSIPTPIETDAVASGGHSHSSSFSSGSDLSQKVEEYSSKLGEYQNALKQRDDVISRLTERLQLTITQHDQQQEEAISQADALVTEIEILKLQLQQANEFLQNQKGKNGISAQELLEAENQAIALQQFLVQKDLIIKNLSQDVSESSQQLQQIKDELQQKDIENQLLQEKITASEINEQTVNLRNGNYLMTASNQTVSAESEQLLNLRNQLEITKRKSSNEVKQLMEDLEDMQKRLQESQLSLKTFENRFDSLRAELDEQYGLQIVEMKTELTRLHCQDNEKLQQKFNELTSERDSLLSLSKSNATDIVAWQEKLREAIFNKEAIEVDYKERLDNANQQIRQLTQANDTNCDKVEHLERLVIQHDEEFKIQIDLLTSEKCENDIRCNELIEQLNSVQVELDRLRVQQKQELFVRVEKSKSDQSVQTLIGGQTTDDKIEQLVGEKLVELEAELNKLQMNYLSILVDQLMTTTSTAILDPIVDDPDYESYLDTVDDEDGEVEDHRQDTSSLQAEVESLRLDNAHLQQTLTEIDERYQSLLTLETGGGDRSLKTLDSNIILNTLRDRVDNLLSELERRDRAYSKVVAELTLLKENSLVDEGEVDFERTTDINVDHDRDDYDNEFVKQLQEKLLEVESFNVQLQIQLKASLEKELKNLKVEENDPEMLRTRLSSSVDEIEKEMITVERVSVLGMIHDDEALMRSELISLKNRLVESENLRSLLELKLAVSIDKQWNLQQELDSMKEEQNDPDYLTTQLSRRVGEIEREGIIVEKVPLLGSDDIPNMFSKIQSLTEKLEVTENDKIKLQDELSRCSAKVQHLKEQLRMLNEELNDPDALKRRLSSRVDLIEKELITVEKATVLGLLGSGDESSIENVRRQLSESQNMIVDLQVEISVREAYQAHLEDRVKWFEEQLSDPDVLRCRLAEIVDHLEKNEIRKEEGIVLGIEREILCDLDSLETEIMLPNRSAEDQCDVIDYSTNNDGLIVVDDDDYDNNFQSQERLPIAELRNDEINCECCFQRTGSEPSSKSLLDFECQVNMEMVVDDLVVATVEKALDEAYCPDRDLVNAGRQLHWEFGKSNFEAERQQDLLEELKQTKTTLAECQEKLRLIESSRSTLEEKESAIRKELEARYDEDVERVRQCLEDSLVTEAHVGVEVQVTELKERVEANIEARNNENDRLCKELDELKMQLKQLQRDKRRLERSFQVDAFTTVDETTDDVEFDDPDPLSNFPPQDSNCPIMRGGEDGVYLQLLTNITSVCLNLAKSIDKEFVALLEEDGNVENKRVDDECCKQQQQQQQQLSLINSQDETVAQDSLVSLLNENDDDNPLPGLEHSLSDIVNEAGNRLSNAVSRLLDLFRESVQQLQESHVVQDQLANNSLQSNDEVVSLSAQNDDLIAHCKVEEQTKNCLAIELHKITDLLKTCEHEKEELEVNVERKENQLIQLMSQFEECRSRNRSLETSLAEEQQRQTLTKEIVAEGLGEHAHIVHSTWNDPNVHVFNSDDEEKILEENSRLHIEKRGLQYHSEKNRSRLTLRIQELEILLEETSTEHDRTIEVKRHEIEDLQQQIDALDKQLKAYKQFVEEQTSEREQEREDFQNELAKLNDVMREKEKFLSSGVQLTREIESLAEQLKEKDFVLKQTIERRDQLERDLQVINDKLNTSQEVLRELERQLDCKSRNEHDLKEELDELKLAFSNSARVHDEQCQEIEELRHASVMSVNNRTLGSIPFLDDYLNENGVDLANASTPESLMLELRSQMLTIEDKVGRHIRDLEAVQLSSSTLSSPCSEEVSVREQLEALRSQQTTVDGYNDQITSIPLEPSFSAFIKDIRRLEDRIESMTRAKEMTIKKTKDLEAQLLKQKQMEDDLLQDREVLQKQLNAQLVLISALQARIEEQRLGVRSIDAGEKFHLIQKELDDHKQAAENKSKIVDDLEEQLSTSNEQIRGYERQIHDLIERYTSDINQNKSEKVTLTRQVDELRIQLETFKIKFEESEKQSNDLSSLLQKVIEEKNQELDMMTAEIERLEKENKDHIETDSKNTGLLIEVRETVINQKEELSRLRNESDALRDNLMETQSKSKELNQLLTVKERELRRTCDAVDQKRREVDALKVVLEEKAQLVEQVQMLQSELHNLNDYQARLQEDFDTVQSMLEDKQTELANVIQEMGEMQMTRDASLEEQCNAKNQLEVLCKQITDKLTNIEDKSIQVEIFNDELVSLKQHNNLLENKCVSLESELAIMNDKHLSFESRIQAERQITIEMDEKLSITLKQLESCRAELKAFTMKLSETRNEFDSLECRAIKLDAELTESNLQKSRLEAEVAWRNNKIFRLEDQLEHLKSNRVDNEEGGGGSQVAVHKFLEEVQKELLSEEVEGDGCLTSAEISTSESDADSSSMIEGLTPNVRVLVKKIYKEGISVLNLSELRSVQENSSTDQNAVALRDSIINKSWYNERRHLIAEIHALKDLLSRLTTTLIASSRDQLHSNASWLPQLLQAVTNLITRENNLLVASVQSAIASSRQTNQVDVQSLQNAINEMNRLFKDVLRDVHRATSFAETDVTASMSVEFQSKSWEVQIAIARERLKHQEEQKKLMEDMRELDHQMGRNERKYKRQMELLKFRVEQEELIAEDLRQSLELEKSHCIELCGQCTRETGRAVHLELATAQLRSELANCRTSTEQLRQDFKNISQQYKTEKAREETLLQSLQAERDSFVQLQEAMEAEKRRAKASYQRDQQIIEELRNSLEAECEKHLETTSTLERERLTLRTVQLELKKLSTNGDLNQNTCLSDDGKLRRRPSDSYSKSNNEDDIREALDLERCKNQELNGVVQREHRRVASLTSSLAQERRQLLQELDAERTNLVQLQCKLDVSQNQKTNLSRDLLRSQEQCIRLETEYERLTVELSLVRGQLQQREQEVDALRQIEQDLHKEFEVDREQERHKQHDLRLTIQKSQQRISFLEKELKFSKQSEVNLQRELDLERQNRETSQNLQTRTARLTKDSGFHECGLETVRQQLLLLLCKSKELESPNCDSLLNAIDELIVQVGHLELPMPLSSSQTEDNFANHLCLTERIVYHNSELAEFARRLCEEKLELRVALSKLVSMKDVESTKSMSPHRNQSPSDQILIAERAAWAQERAGLQRAVHRIDSELIRNMGANRQSSSRLAFLSGRNSDDSKATHFYYKYLRAQSFRKNLIYQKHYLLDLLVGYQDTEAHTLDMLGRLGCVVVENNRAQVGRTTAPISKRISRFKSAVHAIVAFTRMKFLTFKWKRVKHSLCPNNNYSTLPTSTSDGDMVSPCPPASNNCMYPTFTPPVRDTHGGGSDRSSSPPVRRSLSLNSSSYSSTQSLAPLAVAALGEYVQRFDNLQQQLGIGVGVVSPPLSSCHRRRHPTNIEASPN